MAKDQQKIEQVLQSCLDMIESGQETVESVLARYPEFADQLRPELEIALWLSTQKSVLDPRPGWVAASKRRVMARYQEELVTAPTQTGWLGWDTIWNSWLNKKVVQAAFALVLLLSLLVGGNGVVLAARDSLPGDRLYPVKTALEKVNLAISLDETKEAELNLEYTQRRMDEFNRLVLEGRYSDIPESLANLETQVKETIDSLDSAAGQNASQTKMLAASLEGILSVQDKKLDALIESAPDTTRPAIQKAQTVSQSGATATRQLIQTLPNPTPTSAPRKPSGFVAEEPSQNPTSTKASLPTKTLRPLSTATNPPREAPTTAPFTEPTDAPPVTNTPLPPPLPTSTPRPPTFTPTPTNTKVPPVVVTPTDTPTPTATPTDTPTIVPSPTFTNTPVPPTSTDTPTPEPTETLTPTTSASAFGETPEPTTATESPTNNTQSTPPPLAEDQPSPPEE